MFKFFVFSRAVNMLQEWKAIRVVASKPDSESQASVVRAWRQLGM
jgi:hypothetical protein